MPRYSITRKAANGQVLEHCLASNREMANHMFRDECGRAPRFSEQTVALFDSLKGVTLSSHRATPQAEIVRRHADYVTSYLSSQMDDAHRQASKRLVEITSEINNPDYCPDHALSWAENLFSAGGELTALRHAWAQWTRPETTVADLVATANEQVLSSARWDAVSSSSNGCHNLTKGYVLQGWARLAEHLRQTAGSLAGQLEAK